MLVLAVGALGVLGDSTTTEFKFVNNPEVQAGLQVLEEAGLVDADPTNEMVIVRSSTGTIDDAAFQAKVEEVTATLRGMTGVVVLESVTNYYELSANPETAAAATGLVSESRQTTLIPLTLAGDQDGAAENAAAYKETLAEASGDG